MLTYDIREAYKEPAGAGYVSVRMVFDCRNLDGWSMDVEVSTNVLESGADVETEAKWHVAHIKKHRNLDARYRGMVAK